MIEIISPPPLSRLGTGTVSVQTIVEFMIVQGVVFYKCVGLFDVFNI